MVPCGVFFIFLTHKPFVSLFTSVALTNEVFLIVNTLFKKFFMDNAKSLISKDWGWLHD